MRHFPSRSPTHSWSYVHQSLSGAATPLPHNPHLHRFSSSPPFLFCLPEPVCSPLLHRRIFSSGEPHHHQTPFCYFFLPPLPTLRHTLLLMELLSATQELRTTDGGATSSHAGSCNRQTKELKIGELQTNESHAGTSMKGGCNWRTPMLEPTISGDGTSAHRAGTILWKCWNQSSPVLEP